MDGTIEVMLPNGNTIVVPLERLTRLYDSIEQLEDMWGDDEGTIDEGDEIEVWEMDQDGHWVEGSADDDDEWESAEEDDGMEDGDDDDADVDDERNEWSPSNDTVIPQPVQHENAPMLVDASEDAAGASRPSSASHSKSPGVPSETADDDDDDDEGLEGGRPWKRFQVLPSAPADHAYYSTPPAQPSRSFMTRLAKEYKALQSSLPGAPPLPPSV